MKLKQLAFTVLSSFVGAGMADDPTIPSPTKKASVTNNPTSLVDPGLPATKPFKSLSFDIRKGADWAPDNCKTVEEVTAEFQNLYKLTSTIRLYGLDHCNLIDTVLTVYDSIAQSMPGFSMIVGVWVSEKYTDGEIAKFQSIVNRLNTTFVEAIIVGNEALVSGAADAEKLIGYIDDVRKIVEGSKTARGISIGTADFVESFSNGNNSVVLDHVDMVLINAIPYYANFQPSSAVSKTLQKLEDFRAALYDRKLPFQLSEFGWPSGGDKKIAQLDVTASPENQAFVVRDFLRYITYSNISSNFYMGFDIDFILNDQNNADTARGAFGIYASTGNVKDQLVNVIIPRTTNPVFFVPGGDINKLVAVKGDAAYVFDKSSKDFHDMNGKLFLQDITTNQIFSRSSNLCLTFDGNRAISLTVCIWDADYTSQQWTLTDAKTTPMNDADCCLATDPEGKLVLVQCATVTDDYKLVRGYKPDPMEYTF